jgi:hypothetical protein
MGYEVGCKRYNREETINAEEQKDYFLVNNFPLFNISVYCIRGNITRRFVSLVNYRET